MSALCKRLTKRVKLLRGVHSQAHRGVMLLRSGEFALFGNDSYRRSAKSRHQVELLRRRMGPLLKVEEVAFALSDDEETWVMIVRPLEIRSSRDFEVLLESLDNLLWEAWFDACQIASLDGPTEKKLIE